MNRIYWSTMAYGHRLLTSAAELAEFTALTIRYCKKLNQLRKAVASNDQNRVVHMTIRILNSFPGKVSAVARTLDPISGAHPSLADLKAAASGLNLYCPLNEPIRQLAKEQHGRLPRLVLDFGPKRRASQIICVDLLDILLPEFEFDYQAKGKGTDRQALRLKEILETGKYTWVATADVTNAYGSINKEKLAELLPQPAPVVNNVLLVQDDVVVKLADQEVSNELFGLPLSISTHVYSSADAAARKGLPQGSLASSLIMSRAVLGPMLSATIFRDRLLYGDDIILPARSEAEAEDKLHALRSVLENSPVGPLAIGRHAIRHESQRINIPKYGLRRDPWTPGAAFEFCPSARSYDRFGKRAEHRYLDGPVNTAKGRVSRYRKDWTMAFPLWKPNQASLGMLWQTAFEARQNAERRRRALKPTIE